MIAQILLFTQFATFLIMIGTADRLFTTPMATLVFFAAFLIFARCSIYIGKNEKWLIKRHEE